MPSERGLYESLVTEALEAELSSLDPRLVVRRSALHEAEAADRLALHLGRVVERALASLDKQDRVRVGTALARQLVDVVVGATEAISLASERPVEAADVLRSVLGRLPDGSAELIEEPLVPLFDTTLLTNAPGEPRVGSQVLTEVPSADRIDVVMAFIRRSGIRPLLPALRAHCQAARPLRVLTTIYTGSTEGLALDWLKDLGAEIRISYDEGTTRLHAKAWYFFRRSGFSTAYIGSSNLTHSAQVTGLEWNVRASGARNPSVVDKVAAVFESYWNSGEFVPYDAEVFRARTAHAERDRIDVLLSPIELRPEPFQERLLEQVALSRQLGHHRNLLVSATGTGKTVMAALDYARLRSTLPRARLLFVAHRAEILKQTLATFRHALRDHSFGELWVAGDKPAKFEHVFASIQSLNAAGLAHLAPERFDVVIVDEFHHAAAASYQALLGHIHPVELLGLTATPERSDGLPLLEWFDGRIAAELRLWDAIDQHRLVPFAYYGVHDGLDLRDLPWRRGRGYDVEALSNLLTANDAWAHLVIQELTRRIDSLTQMKALGFCVSIDHARFMARSFVSAGIPAVAIWSDTPASEREQALRDLAAGHVRVLFSVDLFNEGVDIPAVDTLLVLRPTESATLFLQQLGRGLRRHSSKNLCTVLDFVGHHRSEFRFDRKLRALLGGTRSDLIKQVERGFPFLPAGCHLELDRVASDIVLSSIKNAVPSRWAAKVEELRAFVHSRRDLTLRAFLQDSALELEDLYAGNQSWSDLCEDAGVTTHPAGPHEPQLRRACGRLLHIDDPTRIDTYQRLLSPDLPPDLARLPEVERRLLRMLIAALLDKVVTKTTSRSDGCDLLWRHPQIRHELLELFAVLRDQLEHITAPLDPNGVVPLAVHAQYTRIEILAAFGIGEGAKVAPWQTGVYWAKHARADLL
ncbi:MAG: DEAD/DEAH box helicase family protein, partial [Myxococcota bacterium]|nr:DEAD/DEAH box helicase family protein [Myxococcota bacterium]